MAVTANQIVKRQGRDGKRVSVGAAASKNIYGGTLVFLDAGGDGTDVKVDANTVFAGISVQQVDNSSGADNDLQVELYADGVFELPITLTDRSDIGSAVHASDNYTPTLTTTANPRIGTLVGFVSTSVGLVQIAGLGEVPA